MGREQYRERKHLSLYAASLILLAVAACASPHAPAARIESVSFQQQVQLLMREGDFDGALKESEEVLARSPELFPGDEALYTMGLIYAHYGNPKKDYSIALSLFTRVVQEFPDSLRADEAMIWIGVLEATEKTKQTDIQKREQMLMRKGDFEGALKEIQEAVAHDPENAHGDEALFYTGLIYAHYKNPKKDHLKALGYFTRVIKEYPKSPRAAEAKVWIGILEAIEKANQVDLQIEEKKKELKK